MGQTQQHAILMELWALISKTSTVRSVSRRYCRTAGEIPLPEKVSFTDLNDAITNILEGDTSNSVAIRNPARTGALRVTANQRVPDVPATTTAKHYHATTTYTYNYVYMFLYALSVVASVIYVAVRLIYIGQGRQSVEIPVNRGFLDEDGNAITAGELMAEVGLGLDDEIPQVTSRPVQFSTTARVTPATSRTFAGRP